MISPSVFPLISPSVAKRRLSTLPEAVTLGPLNSPPALGNPVFATRLAPHFGQNCCGSLTSVPQDGQYMGTSVGDEGRPLASRQAISTIPANLLVVFLLVELYKLMRDRSREVFPRSWPEDSRVAQAGEIQPGRHDFFWIFSPTLATDRSGPPHNRADIAKNL